MLHPLYRDRLHAGKRLAECLAAYQGTNSLVLGIPRGGVPVAAEIARRLYLDLDVVVVRKLGAPMQPELALGAVTAGGWHYLNESLIAESGVTPEELERMMGVEMAAARQREARYRHGRPIQAAWGRTAIIVDDGLATGATMRAAICAVRVQRPLRLVVAAPVAARETCDELRAETGVVDEIVCPHELDRFVAVGLHYEDFDATSDAEVCRLLDEAVARPRCAPSAPPASS
ncbi:MAG TPA: phosphoribosyltransferase family protein [Chloroflexota bacterium]|nr:phosphoribosyltransferase family protein [Chloroflexota bacterium]